ncbi:hypothetical protein EV424DRAFT_1349927 [Suillus variegatus]|nr:hypothetical protein EV424DRAFT_1349927 [Suillus variegatus]
MKSILSLALFVASAFAQGAVIGYPPQGLSVSPGSNLVVQVERPDTLTGSVEVAVVIGIQSCPGTPCINPADYMGQILYNVQIPSSIASGTALLGVVHVTLVGASAGPLMEILNRTITIS